MELSQYLKVNEAKILNDLQKLIAIKTFAGSAKSTKNEPLGNNIASAFALITEISNREGLTVTNYDNYALAVDINPEQSEIEFAFLNHVDTVEIYHPELWDTPPFTLTKVEDVLYGRGVNDNKGPLIYVLYTLIYLKNYTDIKKKIRLIIGGAEETSWAGINYYKQKTINEIPKYAISPDGNFPVINLEKGIIHYQYEVNIKDDYIKSIKSVDDRSLNCAKIKITTKNRDEILVNGIETKSRSPKQGVNVIEKIDATLQTKSDVLKFLVKNFNTYTGDIFNLNDFETAEKQSTFNVSTINYYNDKLVVNFDYRFIYDYDESYIKYKLQKVLTTGTLSKTKLLPFHELDESSKLAKELKQSYESVMGEPLTFHTKGAASYARSFDNALCAGPVFIGEDSKSHKPNEMMKISSLVKACEIYTKLICGLLGGRNER